MQEIADMVFPVFREAIDIKDRLAANDHEPQNFTDSQKKAAGPARSGADRPKTACVPT